MSRSTLPRALALLYNHNPFYLISTCLFVYGLKLLFRSGDSSILFQQGSVAYMEPWGLMASFAGVTLLMAVTAILVVRLGRVWEDARSLVLIVILMLLAMSVSLDELLTLLSDPDHPRSLLFLTVGTGVLFAFGVCEVLIRCLQIRLDAVYRAPFYSFLALFFLWPVLLLPELTGFSHSTTRWLVSGFPTVAAGITLTLLPAVRRGSAAVRSNGTPWSWPLFPWTPFLFIALAVCLRAYSLTISFDLPASHVHFWDTTFGLYQLVPFLLAVLVIVLDIGRVEKIGWLQNAVLFCAPLLLLLAFPSMVPWSKLPAYRHFADTLSSQIAAPAFLTLLGLTAFYGWAWLMKIHRAQIGFYAAVALAGLTCPDTSQALTVLSVVLIVTGFRSNSSIHLVIGILMAMYVGYPTSVPAAESDTSDVWRLLAGLHLALAAVIVVGEYYRDEFSRMLGSAAPFLFFMTTLAAVGILVQAEAGFAFITAYVAAMTTAAYALSRMTSRFGYLRVAVGQAALSTGAGVGAAIYEFFSASMTPGLKPVVMAVLSFSVAVVISILKSGLARKLRLWWLTRQRTATRLN